MEDTQTTFDDYELESIYTRACHMGQDLYEENYGRVIDADDLAEREALDEEMFEEATADLSLDRPQRLVFKAGAWDGIMGDPGASKPDVFMLAEEAV